MAHRETYYPAGEHGFHVYRGLRSGYDDPLIGTCVDAPRDGSPHDYLCPTCGRYKPCKYHCPKCGRRVPCVFHN